MSLMKLKIITLITIIIFILGASAQKNEYFGETYEIIVLKVEDGDTILAEIPSLPPIIGHKIGIRLYGIDTPELHDKRVEIRALANRAKDSLSKKLQKAKKVTITNIRRDKYFRIDAIVIADGINLNAAMLDSKLAKPYDGGKKLPW